jgi:hypothetical protein
MVCHVPTPQRGLQQVHHRWCLDLSLNQLLLLTAGLTDQCQLEFKDLGPSDSRMIAFSIAKGSKMSLSISMRSRGGVADM